MYSCPFVAHTHTLCNEFCNESCNEFCNESCNEFCNESCTESGNEPCNKIRNCVCSPAGAINAIAHNALARTYNEDEANRSRTFICGEGAHVRQHQDILPFSFGFGTRGRGAGRIADGAAHARACIWLFGKTQSGKTSIIKFLTGASDAEIGSGFRPCTRFSREYDFPNAEAPLLSFLDTAVSTNLDTTRLRTWRISMNAPTSSS